jgi:hypothetical protein
MPPPSHSSALATTSAPSLSLQVTSVDDLARLARVFAASGLFGRSQNAEQHTAECAIRLMYGMEAGFTPAASITGVHVIEGKPAFSANLLAQAIRRHPLYDYQVVENSDTVCRIQFTANGKPLGVSTWTIEMAERAGLASKPNWKRYPEAQLFARAMSAGMRTHCPDALNGSPAYVPEELGAAEPVQAVQAVQVAEVPAPQPDIAALVAAAYNACADSGLSDDGLLALVQELSGGDALTLDQLPADILRRLGSAGVSPETVARCNAAAPVDEPLDDPDDLPATWAASA